MGVPSIRSAPATQSAGPHWGCCSIRSSRTQDRPMGLGRKGERVAKELVCHPEVLEKNEHYTLEHLPTHEKHFYDVHRYTVEDAVEVETEGSCQVWMVVEGKAVRVETREGMRQRFNYAETFVIPAAAATYRIINETPGEKVILVKAFIKKGYGFE